MKSLSNFMLFECLLEANINDMKISAEMKSLLQMRNISTSGSRNPSEKHLSEQKKKLSAEIAKVIKQLERKEGGKTSKYDDMLPSLVDMYEDLLKKMNAAAKRQSPFGSPFRYQPPSEFKDTREQSKKIAEARLLGPSGDKNLSASTSQSDREYIHQMSFKSKWKKENPGKQWPGYEKAGYTHPKYGIK